MAKKTFDIAKYKDSFVEELKKALKTKRKKVGKKTATHMPKTKEKKDLVSVLRSSLRPTRSQSIAYASTSRTKKRKKRA
jgi:non-homologous end joining protein Ku